MESSVFKSYNFLVLTVIDCEYSLCNKLLLNYIETIRSGKYMINLEDIDYGKIYKGEPRPGGAFLDKFMIWEPHSLKIKTAFLPNYSDGMYTFIYNFCKIYHLSATSIRLSNNAKDKHCFSLNLFDFTNNKTTERVIYNIKENKRWVFYDKGPIQPFEDVENYQTRFISKRFDRRILLEYLNRLNIQIENNDFWQSKDNKAFYFERLKW